MSDKQKVFLAVAIPVLTVGAIECARKGLWWFVGYVTSIALLALVHLVVERFKLSGLHAEDKPTPPPFGVRLI